MGIRFGLGNNKLVLDEEDSASLLIIPNVKLVLLLEVLGDVDWFLRELKFAAGVWDDEPVFLFVEFVGAQFECGVCSDRVIVDVDVGQDLGFSIKNKQLVFMFTLSIDNRIQMNQLMS